MVPAGTHDLFYTNANIKTAYKNYIRAVVTRYSASDPAIFAWQLANEVSRLHQTFNIIFFADKESPAAKVLLELARLVTQPP